MPLTAEQIEKSRAEFEAEYSKDYASHFDCSRYLARFTDGGYKLINTALAWKYWLARQETLCVELPAMNCDHDDGFHTYDAWPVQIAIEAAGIAHK